MTLEKLSLIRYYASSPNPYSDEYFLHMLRISPLWKRYILVMAELDYAASLHDVCYNCHDWDQVYDIFLIHYHLFGHLASPMTRKEALFIITEYTKTKFLFTEEPCLNCQISYSF